MKRSGCIDGAARVYTVYSETDLTDAVWQEPITSGSRFLKVEVEMPSP